MSLTTGLVSTGVILTVPVLHADVFLLDDGKRVEAEGFKFLDGRFM